MWLSFLFILILSGILTYIILRQTVSKLTAVPLWILWAILMLPPLLTGATVTWSRQIPPLPVAIVVCSICWVLYWRLLDWGRPNPRTLAKPPDPQIMSEAAVNEHSATTRTTEPELTALPEEPEPIEENRPLRPIEAEEEATLRTCFAWNIFFLEKIEYRPQAVLCRGKLRTDADSAYATIVRNITDLFGDRFFILFQYSLSTGKPFFALVPRPEHTQITRSRRYVDYTIAVLLLLLTLVPTTYFGAALAGLPKGDFGQIVSAGWPYAASIIFMLGIRDVGRYLVAKFYKIDSTLPYFIPLPFLPGTYGCLVQMRSPIPDRKAVFDLGFVASMLGLVTSIPILLWGLSQSQTVPLDLKSTLFNFHSFNPRFSLLMTLLSKLALGSQFVAERAIDLNSVAIAAYISLLIITINLMPLRRLDGGYIVHAMFGQKPSAIVSQLSKIILVILGIIRLRASEAGNTDLLFLAIVISLIPAIDEPALNDVSDLNNWRDGLGVFILGILVLTLIPVPAVLMQWLDI
ncbi:site-2 protease family protein [Chamaesiphon polymorphus]|uniref:Site-2 protease family protein n=1 Tax=Chamaesiphon polymorphus CCALA 037 TaxID=2107692 RepID=A0A2T1G814_9CYAN|nr:site-2 protease family protein [Chamaesiphon polymorphus]PSB53374.1 site-2 protease family protein [Chamaesiphon polymorphus CCALA 037]